MLKSLKIENFRCFQNFELQQLGRVNLLVGTNNSGKTSVLEAIQLLCSGANLEKLGEIMTNRGEYYLSEERVGNMERYRELDIRHLFYGYDVKLGSNFSIFSTNDNEGKELVISVQQVIKSSSEDLPELVLRIEWLGQDKEVTTLPLSPNEGLLVAYIRRVYREAKNPESKIQFVTSSSLTSGEMVKLFDQVILQPEEEIVTDALKIIVTVQRGNERMRVKGAGRWRKEEREEGRKKAIKS